MTAYILRRLLIAVPTVLGVVTIVFFVLHLTPGDPVNLMIPPDVPSNIRADRVAQINARYGFDQPLYVQYGRYLWNVAQLDLGDSLRQQQPVLNDLKRRIPNTLQLALLSLTISATLGIGLGVISAIKHGTWTDNATMLGALAGVSMPNFWLGLLLGLALGLHLGILPISGYGGPIWTWEGFRHLILPAFTLGTAGAGILARFTRSSMLEVINQDYIRTARAKGLAHQRVIIRHALKNALIPIITLLGLEFGAMLSGAIIVETVFAYPGVGRYLITGIEARDFPVVQATVLVIAVGFVLINLFTDILYTYIDPRIRYN
jgi:ABC-type dipeptide/oligopeptide/nickel transport system permease component